MPYLVVDPYADEDGFYNVNSLYFDSQDFRFCQEQLNGQPFRQKLRLRSYNNVAIDDLVFLEIKKKYKGVVNKRRTPILLNRAYAFLRDYNHDVSTLPAGTNPQIMREVAFLCRRFELQPQVLLSYRRQSFFVAGDPSIRITFDSNVVESRNRLRLENLDYGSSILPSQVYIMEVKVNDSLPFWLVRILAQAGCHRQSFSKYSTSLTHDIIDR